MTNQTFSGAANHPVALRVVIFFLGIFYLATVLITSTQHSISDVTKGSSFGKFVDYAGFASGASNHFGFFAPGVQSQFRASFVAKSQNGEQIASGEINQGNFETSFRYHNMIENFWTQNDEFQMRRALSASWASKVLSKYPNAANVKIVLEAYSIPSMRQYRSGDRPHWVQHYKAEYTKGQTL